MQLARSKSLIKQFTTVVAIACVLVITFTVFGAYSLLKHNDSILTLSEKKSETQSTLELIDQALYDHLMVYVKNNNIPDKQTLITIDQRFTTLAHNAREKLSPSLMPHLQAIETAWSELLKKKQCRLPEYFTRQPPCRPSFKKSA